MAVGETAVIEYSYNVIDSNGGTVAQTATITITGENDAPDISLGSDDTAADTLSETDSGLDTDGTLTVFDVDVSDEVSVAVTGLVESGTTAGLGTLAMLTLTAADPAIDNVSTSGVFNWSFDSLGESFDYLAVG